MIIDINKIIVKDRIRKDYGNIQELADDIKRNGLINPPTISRSYVLIAGERRLKACRDILHWKQIEVHQMDVDDAEKQLYMEISENESRKEFTMMERLDYARQIARVESAKAKERRNSTLKQNTDVPNSAPRSELGKTRDKVAAAIDMGHDTLRKAQYIADHKNVVSTEDFANWDDGKLSTNKVYNQIKAKLKKQEEESQRLKRELEERFKPQVVTKEVIPDDYESNKRELNKARDENISLSEDNKSLRERAEAAEQRVKELEENTQPIGYADDYTEDTQDPYEDKYNMEAVTFVGGMREFINNYGGYAQLTKQKLSPGNVRAISTALEGIEDWVNEIKSNIKEYNYGRNYVNV